MQQLLPHPFQYGTEQTFNYGTDIKKQVERSLLSYPLDASVLFIVLFYASILFMVLNIQRDYNAAKKAVMEKQMLFCPRAILMNKAT